MRKLIMERLNNIWCDELEGIHEIAQSEFSLMSDEELLDLYDEVFGFSGQVIPRLPVVNAPVQAICFGHRSNTVPIFLTFVY